MDDLQRIANPSLPVLRLLFDSGSWQRGAAYTRQGRVRQLTLEDDENAALGWVVNAKVTGSYGAPYDTGMDLAQDDAGQWWFHSHCTCPVGLHCKHQAALVQRVAELYPEVVPEAAPATSGGTVTKQPVQAALSDVEEILAHKMMLVQAMSTVPIPSRFAKSGAPAAVPVAPEVARQQTFERWWSELDRHAPQSYQSKLLNDGEVVLFELGLRYSFVTRHQQTVRVTLSCRRVKLLKTRAGQPQQYGKLRTFGSGTVRSAVQSGDMVFREVVQWQWAEQSRSSGHYWNETLENSPIEDAFALQVLERAVRSGRVVQADAQNHPGPVWHWGEPRTLNWHWEREEDGLWWLRARIGDDMLGAAPSSALAPLAALPGPVSFYMDRRSHQIGCLDLAGLPYERVERLLVAPGFAEDWLRRSEMQTQALRLLPSLPEGVGTPVVRRISGVMPQPVLQISFNPADGDPRFTLSFDYAGLRDFWPLSSPAQQFVETDAGLVDLSRDLDAERAAVTQCRALGCMPLADSPDEVWQLLGILNQRLQHFGVWLANDFAPWRAAGFVIETGPDWAAHVRHADALDVALGGAGAGETFDIEPSTQPETAADWLQLSIGFRFGEQRFNLLPWLPQLVAQAHARPGEALQAPERLWISDEHGTWWSLPGAALQPWLAALVELVAERPPGTFAADSLKLTRIEALRLGAETVQVDLPGGQRGVSALHDILNARQDEATTSPAGITADLRPYQRQGLAWLQALARQQLGGVLADDMGLGKTLQTIAHLAAEQAGGALDRPALVVVPTSLVGNWRRECARFAPGLRVLVLHGLARRELFDVIGDHDVVLTTYPLLPRDAEVLIKQPWHVVVLDEAQTIKNAKTQAAQVVQLLQARHRLCLSGTPMENHLGEIWSLFEFLLPGYLSSEARFKGLFRTPIEKHGDTARLDLLRRRLAPFMLRRTKDMVATELPPKVETVVRVQLDEPQANLYETIRLTTEETVREALQEKGLARSHIMVLDALLKLRQVCCDPRLVPLAQARKVKVSAKLDWLMQTLPAMIEEGRRVLLFSQFTSMLALIEARLEAAGLAWVKLTGESQNRDALVERFTSGAVPIFLISLKAGGVGLNLPQADTVIHYDPWWNPAVENQATDRAHRIGQTQTVFVYKLVAEDTLEERILALQERKAALAAGLHGAAGASGVQLTEADLAWLLKPLGAAIEDRAASTGTPVLEISDAH